MRRIDTRRKESPVFRFFDSIRDNDKPKSARQQNDYAALFVR
jgi:hypothetical protein